MSMDPIAPIGAGDGSSRRSAFEEWLTQALLQDLQSAGREPLRMAWSVPGSEAVEGVARADVRGGVGMPDDGGERLSTAPSAIDLNGRDRHAWGAQAAELIARAHAQPWSAAHAHQDGQVDDSANLPALPKESSTMAPAVAPTDDGTRTSPSASTNANVRDAQAGSVLDWDRFLRDAAKR